MKPKFSLIQIFCIFFLIISVFASPAISQTTVKVNPDNRYQEMKGWGGSLCWWAVLAGGFSEDKVNEIATWITSPDQLNMNVFRYNIGGGENPSHNHMRKGGEVPGFKSSATAAYDWTQDENQRKMLVKLNGMRKDVINEAFSNSPPHWMTKSGCASGNTDGTENLKDDQYPAFADYLTEVVKKYKEDWNITFNTVEPVNEPFSTWWKSEGGQEGCKFGQASQHKIILELHKSLTAKNMLGYTGISMMDANSLDEAVKGVNAYVSAGNIISKIIQINAHSYSGSQRTQLNTLAKTHDKILWQSETGPLSSNLSGMANYLMISQRLITDLRDMKPVVWLDWQLAADNEPTWSLINTNYTTQAISKNKSFYVRMQCSRFIKQGYTIIETNAPNSVAAIHPLGSEVVVVVCNEKTTNENFALDLSAFKSVDAPLVYRTSSSENCTSIKGQVFENKKLTYAAPGQTLTTFVIPVSSVVAANEEKQEFDLWSASCYANFISNNIKINGQGKFEYACYDLEGKEIAHGVANHTIEVGADWPAGIYLIQVSIAGKNKFFKIMKN